MTPAQLRTRLAALGITQVGAAAKLGIGGRTMRRYLSAAGRVPAWMERALRDLEREAIIMAACPMIETTQL